MKAMEVFETVLSDEGIALEIEEDVSFIGFGKASQTKSGDWCKELEFEFSCKTAFQLNAGLLANAREALGRAAFWFPGQGHSEFGKLRTRRDPVLFEFGDLKARDPCHEAKMVVVAALLVAAGAPHADIAMRGRFRI